MNELNNTSEKIIAAFIELFRDYGYKGTTTRAISEKAGVNEVTIFRHFGNKKGILDAALDKFAYSPHLVKIIQEKITWDLEHDLMVMAESYHNYMNEIKDIVLISFREAGLYPELNETLIEFPKQVKTNLVYYLNEMKRRNKIIDTDIELQAMNFIWLNFGYIISKSRFQDHLTSHTTEEFLMNSVKLFARGLTP